MPLEIAIHIDTSGLDYVDKLDQTIEKVSKELAQQLSGMVYSKAVEYAGQRLHSRHEMFLEGLHPPVFVDGAYVVELDAKLMWIEDGMEPYDMLDGLLAAKKGKKIRTDKQGAKYVVVPFHHGGEGARSTPTPAQQDLIATIKKTMDDKKISWSDIEVTKRGNPKLGRLHSFNIMDAPNKTHEGPEQGKGPVGSVRQGNTGIPFLQGVNVNQRKVKGKVQREIVTYRIASEAHRGQKWMHPGLQPAHILLDVWKWAEQEMRDKIAPQVVEQIMRSL
jgi:hypothetical protein